MPSSPICSSVAQSLNVLQYRPSKVVLDLHAIQSRSKLKNLVLRKIPNFCRIMYVKTRHETRRSRRPDTEEGSKGCLDGVRSGSDASL